MDEWLDTQGLYRKNTALDGTCLFRAVAEQLLTYHVPKGHIILREQCIKFMRKHRHLFEGKILERFQTFLNGSKRLIKCSAVHSRGRQVISWRNDWNLSKIYTMISGPFDEYLENLSDLKQWAGQLELEALSLIYRPQIVYAIHMLHKPLPYTILACYHHGYLLYRVDFLVFKSIDLAPVQATQNGFEKKIMLCFTPDNFYDAVYPKNYIENAGFCQSIVYGILYRGVFKLEDLEYAVEKMLHDKSARAQREKYLNSRSQCREDCYDFYIEDSDGPINMKELLDMGAIPFPYKVAKALDPDIYRNIDFDNWVDTLRVPRKNSFWFGNGGPLRVGVKCLLKLDDKCYSAHVQEMSSDYGPVLVFVEELGEKLTVPFENLEPLPRSSLKPEWTFSHKHQIINKLNFNKNSGSGGGEDNANKGKSRNKNREVKESMKYGSGDRKRDTSDRPMNMDFGEENRSGVANGAGNGSDNNHGDSSKNDGSNGVIYAEPDSTTPNYNLSVTVPSPQATFGNNMILTTWSSPCRALPQPHIVKGVNLMVNKSVKNDYSDLPLSDLGTIRFFFNLGIDYFRMGCLVWPGLPSADDAYSVHDPNRCFTKQLDDGSGIGNGNGSGGGKAKSFKSGQKPPRFLEMENSDVKPTSTDKIQRNVSAEDNYTGEVVAATEPIPMTAVPYTPPYAVQYPIQYRVPGYARQPLQEPVSLDPTPIAQIGYPDHSPHYMEPPYPIPYTVYPHPQYYYQN